MNITVGMVSLGCAKNLVDSEIALGYLQKANYRIVNDPAQAEVIIINTCGFIQAAKEESINTILEMAKFKDIAKCRCLIVMGCLSARYKEELYREMPEIDYLLGFNEMALLPTVIDKAYRGEHGCCFKDQYFSYDDPPRLISTGIHSAYLKIAEGCSHHCGFCVIPKIRGRYRSRKPESIVAEANELATNGYKELVLIAQDTTQYGKDLTDKNSLVSLLSELVNISVPWIRILYAYPTTISDELIKLISEHDNIIRYLDIPLQHAAKSVLQRMKRPGDYQRNLALIDKIRQEIPGVTLRSSFIVGFPGETEAEFNMLLQFLTEARLEHCGIFCYSREEDTSAYNLPNQIDDQIKLQRYDQAMRLQQEISLQQQRKLLGQKLEVLIEGFSNESDSVIVGRHRGQAPDVDGQVYIGNRLATAGELVNVRITEVHPYDLLGEIIEGDVN